ncbi:MAG: HD domain-containing protein [Desulfovibrionaceae bacterium]|jgi:HD-GYP domain-containing protein (c-di-GMP phosphodiesterase class II)|nr:HD domain-containing protein [Desulfovibrionaceae bacterium]
MSEQESRQAARPVQRQAAAPTRLSFVPVSPLLIRPWSKGPFSVYLRQDDRYVLYTSLGEAFTPRHRNKLFDMGVGEIYILATQQEQYEGYLEDNLGDLLADEDIPLPQRSEAFMEASTAVVRDLFGKKLPEPLSGEAYARIRQVVEDGVRFLGRKESLRHVARLISHDYEIYRHSINVMIFTLFVLQTVDGFDQDRLCRCAVGALLHDFGKAGVPRAILHKKPEHMLPEDETLLRAHPNKGVALCAQVPMPQEALNAILFHHEREDGSGYPAGIRGEEIPIYVRALSVCDAYDNLTADTSWAKAKKPFEALKEIKAHVAEFDPDMIRRLVLVLANAQIV